MTMPRQTELCLLFKGFEFELIPKLQRSLGHLTEDVNIFLCRWLTRTERGENLPQLPHFGPAFKRLAKEVSCVSL